ncbi:MAG: filamentous hemagglutinin N-terminal domain-containing protein [Burkholderiaceae bacterium]|nr:filamentous hemagglutinin N-terminal domain-containing protein [Burkholderiaceae bacterium]
MNHVYRVVFNRVQGVWQAVTENAKSQGKIGGTVRRHARRTATRSTIGAQTAAAVIAATGVSGAVETLAGFNTVSAQPAANQLPQGASIAGGTITIDQSGAQMQINQSTQKGIINWQSFDVGSKASVHFNQPNADAATLNRVNSANASQIHGQISAVGKVFLLNSNGVVFGPSARVNVGALVAGAMKITDEDFLAGNYKFTEGKGVITNMGELTAEEGGLIALLAPQVINEGVIRAQKGTIVLAAGEAITLTNLASNVTVIVEKPALDALIKNKHLVSAPDGRVFMSTRAAHQLARAVISNTGTIEATGARRVGDVIRLEGNTIINEGVITASNTENKQNTTSTQNTTNKQGSDIKITAAKDVKNTGKIESSGDQGGKIAIAAGETVTNEGQIEARGTQLAGGEITIDAKNVQNIGTIDATGKTQGGKVTIAAAQTISNEGEILAEGEVGGQIRLTANEINQAVNSTISARSVAMADENADYLQDDPALEQSLQQELQQAKITIDATHAVNLQGKLDVSSINHDGGTLTIKADVAQFMDIELNAASSLATGGDVDIESSVTMLDNALIDVSGTIKAGQVFMRAPEPEVPTMPTAPPEPVPVNPSTLIIQHTNITASSRKGQGGKVYLTADTIDLAHTLVLATGDTAGGQIKVGGDWQGGPYLPEAQSVTLDKNTTLNTSAITQGNGGMIVVWSDITNPQGRTIALGTLISEGGQQGGDGGKIETSGYDLKVDGITISTKANEAAGGKTGEWLLDPYNITIDGSGTSVSGNFTASTNSTILASSIQSALGSSNVTIFTGARYTAGTGGTITVNAAITSGTANTLELKAAKDIIINQNITRSGTGGLTLRAGSGLIHGPRLWHRQFAAPCPRQIHQSR